MPTSLKNLSGPVKKNLPPAKKKKAVIGTDSKNPVTKTKPGSKPEARSDATPAEAIIESDAVKAVAKKPAPKKTSAKASTRKKAPAKTKQPKSTKKSTTATKKTSRKTKKQTS